MTNRSDPIAQYRHLVDDIIQTLSSIALYLNESFSTENSEIAGLNGPIELHQSTLDLCPLGHPDQAACSLRSLAFSLWDSYKKKGTMSDLEEAIILCRVALAAYPLGHSSRADTFSQLSSFLDEIYYIELDKNYDLDDAIALHRVALDLCPTDYLGRFVSLHGLAYCLYQRYSERNTMFDLDEAIVVNRSALELLPLDGDSNPATTFCNLAGCLEQRFLKLSALADLEEAIEHRRSELDLLPTDHFLTFHCLYNLAGDLWHRYRKQNIRSDLHEAIVLYRRALEHPSCPDFCLVVTLEKLGECLKEKFIDLGTNADLDEAIGLHRLLLDFPPVSRQERALFLHKLAICLRIRYENQGTLHDLDEAITLNRSTLELLGHSDCAATRSPADCLNERSKDYRPADHSNRSKKRSMRVGRCKKIVVNQEVCVSSEKDANDATVFDKGALVFEGHLDHADSSNTPIDYRKLAKGQGLISQSVHPTDTGSRFKSIINDTIQNVRKRFVRSARTMLH